MYPQELAQLVAENAALRFALEMLYDDCDIDRNRESMVRARRVLPMRPSEPHAPAAALATETEPNQQRLSPSDEKAAIAYRALTDIAYNHKGTGTAFQLSEIARKALESLHGNQK